MLQASTSTNRFTGLPHGGRLRRFGRLTVTAAALAFGGSALAPPAHAELNDCAINRVCFWETSNFAGTPTKQTSTSMVNFKSVPNLNDNVRSMRNRTSFAAYPFQNPAYRTDDGGGFPLKIPEPMMCLAPQTTLSLGQFRNRSSLLIANDSTCFPSARMTQAADAACPAGTICAYVNPGFRAPMAHFIRSDKDFSDNLGMEDSISSVFNRSSKAVYFFRSARFAHDLNVGGADLVPLCVAAGATDPSIGSYNDRLSSALVSKSARCEFTR